jgi:xanthine dehydrogenase small subunit
MGVYNKISFFLNDELCEVGGDETLLTLADFLRRKRALTGTKIVCGEGDCGACTLLFNSFMGKSLSDYLPVNSCILPLFAIHGGHVITVEGLTKYHSTLMTEIQDSLVRNHGTQCGYCTPGIVAALSAYFNTRPKKVDMSSIKNALTGNLCRCTGYLPIIEAALEVNQSKINNLSTLYNSKTIKQKLSEARKKNIVLETAQSSIYIPTSTRQLMSIKRKKTSSMIFSGGTDIVVQHKHHRPLPKNIISLNSIQEFYECDVREGQVAIGPKTTLSDLEALIKKKIPVLKGFLAIFASPQIRNVGTIIGNLANGSPIGDMLPPMFALEAMIHIKGKGKVRVIPIDKLYTGYKKLSLKKDEVIVKLSFPVPHKKSVLKFYKVSQRRDMDITTISTAIVLNYNKQGISKFKLAMGGVSPVVRCSSEVETCAMGENLTSSLIDRVSDVIEKEITPISDLRGSEEFRRLLAVNILKGFKCDLQSEGHL